MEPAEQAQENAAPVEEAPAAVPEPEPTPPSIADGVERSLDPRSVTLARLGGWIFAGVVFLVDSGALAIVLAQEEVPVWVKALVGLGWGSVTLALSWVAQRWPPIEHRHASYKVDGRGIEIRRGVVWRSVVNVPRSRVQHTDVSQGPLERRFGLGTLVIYTAGTDHARVNLSGLDHGTALKIRDHLLPGEDEDAV
ncbi:MAG TPA: PH domain-containing protein [Thermoanaerobaculia bacterium]